MKTIDVTAGIIIEANRVLITRRAPREKFAGGWGFPGGKIEEGEMAKECLARELREELNIEVAVGEFCTSVLHDYGIIRINLMA